MHDPRIPRSRAADVAPARLHADRDAGRRRRSPACCRASPTRRSKARCCARAATDALVALMQAQLAQERYRANNSSYGDLADDRRARHVRRRATTRSQVASNSARRLRARWPPPRRPGARCRLPAPAPRVAGGSRRPTPRAPTRRRRTRPTSTAGAGASDAAPRRSRGLSLVELLVGIAIGLSSSPPAATVVSRHAAREPRAAARSRLMQDLRTAADLVARDLRRAGYWGAAASGVRGDDGSAGHRQPVRRDRAASARPSEAVRLSFSRDAGENGSVDDNERSASACATARSRSSSAPPTGRRSAIRHAARHRLRRRRRASRRSTSQAFCARRLAPSAARPVRRGSRCAASRSRSTARSVADPARACAAPQQRPAAQRCGRRQLRGLSMRRRHAPPASAASAAPRRCSSRCCSASRWCSPSPSPTATSSSRSAPRPTSTARPRRSRPPRPASNGRWRGSTTRPHRRRLPAERRSRRDLVSRALRCRSTATRRLAPRPGTMPARRHRCRRPASAATPAGRAAARRAAAPVVAAPMAARPRPAFSVAFAPARGPAWSASSPPAARRLGARLRRERRRRPRGRRAARSRARRCCRRCAPRRPRR